MSFRMDWLDLLAVQGTLKSLDTSVAGKADHQKESVRRSRASLEF